MVRQYVGARYVPKFADPVAWTSGTSYEAMTIVTYNNSSYTSKVPVPPTVGTPASSPQYWALTGNYNAQVEQYRQDTAKVSEKITKETQDRINADNAITQTVSQNKQDLETSIAQNKQDVNETKNLLISPMIRYRNYIVIGDSWGVGYLSASMIGWPEYLSHILPHDNWYTKSEGSMGFVGKAVGTEHTFLTCLQSMASDIPKPEDIDCIIIGGGANDNYDTTTLNTAIESFVNYATATYPNATVYVIACNIQLPYDLTWLSTGSCYAKASNYSTHARGINIVNCVPGNLYTEPLHCTDDGYKLCAECIAQAILGIPISCGNQNYKSTFSSSDGKIQLQIGELWNNGAVNIYATIQSFFGTEIASNYGNTVDLTLDSGNKWFNIPIYTSCVGFGRAVIGAENLPIGLGFSVTGSNTAQLLFDAKYVEGGNISALVVSRILSAFPRTF